MRKFPLLATLATVPLAVAAFALPASASAAHPRPISNATTVCGSACVDVSTIFGGPFEIQNAHNGFNPGDRIGLRAASDAFTNEDFQASFTGIVGSVTTPGSACFAGLLPPDSKLCLDGLYHFDPVWQLVGAPDANQTDLCVGVTAPLQDQKLRLVPCQSTTTLWVADLPNAHSGGVPWINGADTSFSNPLVATVLGGDTAGIHDQMELTRENPSAGVVSDHKQLRVTDGPA